jgi:hypothetical protein
MARVSALVLLVAVAAPGAPSVAFGEAREVPRGGSWLPVRCRSVLEVVAAAGEVEAPDSAEARWNLHYRHGVASIREEDLEAAERSLCLALDAARAFEPRDARFAETLDELGLAAYLRGDDASAEAMQGAATAEILLALGPPARDLAPGEKARCGINFPTFLGRLGLVFERQGRGAVLGDLQRSPFLVLGMGYVPAQALLGRLDWLVSRYLLAEDLAAADWLRELQERLGAERPAP